MCKYRLGSLFLVHFFPLLPLNNVSNLPDSIWIISFLKIFLYSCPKYSYVPDLVDDVYTEENIQRNTLLINEFVHSHSLSPSSFLSPFQEAAHGAQEGEGAQEAGHQETAERLHALHEGDEGKGHRWVHVKGERRHQPDSGAEGEQSTRTHTHTHKSRFQVSL